MDATLLSRRTRSKKPERSSKSGHVRHKVIQKGRNGRIGSKSQIKQQTPSDLKFDQDIPPTPSHEMEEVIALTEFLCENDDKWENGSSEVDIDLSLSTIKPIHSSNAAQQTERTSQIHQFLEQRTIFLDEFLRLEGLGDYLCKRSCACSTEKPRDYRCLDCDGSTPKCQACILNQHKENHLHRIEKWNGKFFMKTSLQKLGAYVQFGHGEDPCPYPVSLSRPFTVIHTNGIHYITIRFCGCIHAPPYYVQLLRFRWFPTSYIQPRTAFTLEALDLFHRLTLQGKLSMYDYYTALCHKTDNTGLNKPKSRYNEAGLAARFYRHLKMLKRAGRGHDSAGVSATELGKLSVECPACPHPDKNLPDGWESAPVEMRFIYTLFIAIDANFRLKGKNRQLSDVPLAPGWAYFVDEGPYHTYVQERITEVEINMCQSRLHAIDHANKRSNSYSISGVGASKCARHTFIRANGVGDLQRGEKYCNMDYILFSSLRQATTLLPLVLSYDIFCQWSKNLGHRMVSYPPEICSPGSFLQVRGAVPTFHLGGHGDDCYGKYGFPCLPGVGRTCGEGVETEWAAINLVATSIREMTPAARQETLNCHWGFWNWRKITEFGQYFLRKFKEAVYQRNTQQDLFQKFTATFSEELITEWSLLVAAWDEAVLRWQSSLYQRELQPKIKDPYREPETAISLATVKKEILLEEEAEHARGGDNIVIHEVTPCMMLLSGLELEEQINYLLYLQERSPTITAAVSANLQHKIVVLRRRITAWREHQILYMPFVSQALLDIELAAAEEEDRTINTRARDFTLFLPSHLAPEHFQRCSERLANDELRLRTGQADDALVELRRHLRVRHALLSYKKWQVVGTGQGPNTRARAILNRYSEKIERQVQRYNSAREALQKLRPDGSWRFRLQELKRSDLTFPSSREDPMLCNEGPQKKRTKTSQGRREISWIWLLGSHSQGTRNEEEEINDSMRVEWVKSRARVQRWEEEVLLLVEEMRCVVTWLDWKGRDWKEHASARQGACLEIESGLQAYAWQQYEMYSAMASSYASLWCPILESHGFSCSWANKYCIEAGTKRENDSKDDGDNEGTEEDLSRS